MIKGHSDSVSKTIFNNTRIGFGVWGTAVFGFASSLSLFISLLFDGSFDLLRSKLGLI